MRVLAIETSSSRGSVALAEGVTVVASFEHEEPNAHAERLLPLVERALAEAGWNKRHVARVAVGVGPGSFTGLRVGIALAEGLSVGLGVPLVGVGALLAMARAVPSSTSGLRVPVLDARRGEVFVAAYGPDGVERMRPRALALDTARGELAALGEPWTLVGAFGRALGEDLPRLEGRELDLPHARWVAVLGSELVPEMHPSEPIYLRGAGATLPDLPPSPLAGRSLEPG